MVLLSTILTAAYALSGSLLAVGTYRLSSAFPNYERDKNNTNENLATLNFEQLNQRHGNNQLNTAEEYLQEMAEPEGRALPIKYEILRPILQQQGLDTNTNIDYSGFPDITIPKKRTRRAEKVDIDVEKLEHRQRLLDLSPQQLKSSIMKRHTRSKL